MAQGDPLTWDQVENRLVGSVHYWLASTYPDGRPHVVPRWGVWFDDAFWYDGSPKTRHAINLSKNPHCSLHLESGSEVTILEGISNASNPIVGALGEHLSEKFRLKYEELGYAPESDAWSDDIAGGLRVLTPTKVIAWSTFPTDVTRFTFEATRP